MNIIELAEQANGEPAWPGGVAWTWDELERFAKLVAAHEREECAKLCEVEADDGTEGAWDGCCLFLAGQIRARSNT